MPEPRLPYIPEYITVHLGRPDENAPNVQVPFSDYIKNVASSEIYPTWPENALRANIYAQISFALNRIYTEWYRSKGYNFDITNSTQFDQAYVQGRDIFDNISKIVDEIFNDYVVKQGSVEPYFTQFCNGTTSKCKGLSQWGTVDLAKKGYTPYEILTYYYGDDINIVNNAPVQEIKQSYPGVALRLGMAGNDVRVIQLQLNRIRENFPSITKINSPDGVFGVETEQAVKDFQKTFNLTVDGVVGKSTWYKIKEIYNGVKQLSELTSEGVRLEDVTPVYETELKLGSVGLEVQVIQYYLNVIAYFNPNIPLIKMDGIYGSKTAEAVTAFQNEYGLTPTGTINVETWEKMRAVYERTVSSLQPGYQGERAKIFPGYTLKKGMDNADVKNLQIYLALIADNYPEIPKPGVTGYFGNETYNAVLAFQKKYGLPQTGLVGAITWNQISNVYNGIKGV